MYPCRYSFSSLWLEFRIICLTIQERNLKHIIWDHQLISTNPNTSMALILKSLEEQRGVFSKVSHFSVWPNLIFSSKYMAVPPLQLEMSKCPAIRQWSCYDHLTLRRRWPSCCPPTWTAPWPCPSSCRPPPRPPRHRSGPCSPTRTWSASSSSRTWTGTSRRYRNISVACLNTTILFNLVVEICLRRSKSLHTFIIFLIWAICSKHLWG